jgi:hypothetical protein
MPQTHLVNALRTVIAPQTIAINAAIPGIATARAPFALPLLVLDSLHDDPEWPFDVANTDAGTVAVF